MATGSWMEAKRCNCRADLKRFITRSRLRVDWCEFSARLFKPLCERCSTPGMIWRFAAGYEFIELLFRHRGSLVPREMILNRLYAGKGEPKEKIIDVYAHRLRTKLKKAFGRSILLETVWGRGIVLKLTSRRNSDLLEQRIPQRVSGSNRLFFNDDFT